MCNTEAVLRSSQHRTLPKYLRTVNTKLTQKCILALVLCALKIILMQLQCCVAARSEIYDANIVVLFSVLNLAAS